MNTAPTDTLYRRLVAIDTETSGLDPATDEILQIAACTARPDSIPFVAYVLPEKEVPMDAALVNGYSRERWEQSNAMTLKHALIAFQHWLQKEKDAAHGVELMPLAHNAAFDRAFIQAAEQRSGIRLGLTHLWRCSMVAYLTAQDAGIHPQGYANLDTLGQKSGYWKKEARHQRHDALQDAQCCLHSYLWLLDTLTGCVGSKKERSAAA